METPLRRQATYSVVFPPIVSNVMSDESQRTTDHDAIREWAEERDGRPARVEGTGDGDGGGLLRIDIEDADDEDENLEHVEWDEFFETFEENDLAFLYQEETDGDTSYFSKFVSR